MANIFISYRRDDAGGHAGRLCDRLNTRLGDDRVFMDIQDIRPGQDFGRSIDQTIAGCDFVLAVIGPRWLESIAARGGSEDYVRHEVAAALRRNVTVIPVLVGGARMPAGHLLPPELAPLSRRNAVEIRDAHFDVDVASLGSFLENSLGVAPRRPQAGSSARRVILVAAALVVIGVVAAIAGLLVAPRWTQRGAAAADARDGGAEPATGAVASPAMSRTPTVAPPQLAGGWVAEMQKEGQRPYRIRLEFVGGAGGYAGTVRYPTGDGVIEDVLVEGSAISFKTVHVPQFESNPATIAYRGELAADEIRLTRIDSGGVATGVAHRAPGRRGGPAQRGRSSSSP